MPRVASHRMIRFMGMTRARGVPLPCPLVVGVALVPTLQRAAYIVRRQSIEVVVAVGAVAQAARVAGQVARASKTESTTCRS